MSDLYTGGKVRKVIAAFTAGYPVDGPAPTTIGAVSIMSSAFVVTLCVCDDGTCFQLRQAADESEPRWFPFAPDPIAFLSRMWKFAN